MSNLLQNGDFSSPDLGLIIIPDPFLSFQTGENSYLYYGDMTTDQQTELFWTCNNAITLQNGISSFNYPDPTTYPIPNKNQFVGIQPGALIQQTVNITQTGKYTLRFFYAPRQSSDFNQLKIYFGGNLIDTLTEYDTNNAWTEYVVVIPIISIGNKVLLFQGETTQLDKNIALANVQLSYFAPLITSAPVISTPPNLITNGNLSTPLLTVNTFLKPSSMTATQLQQFYWTTYSGAANVLQNGSTSSYTFAQPSPSPQYFIMINLSGYLQQTVNIVSAGTYTLSFHYCSQTNNPQEGVNIYLDGVLQAALVSINQKWIFFTTPIVISNAGNKVLKIIGILVIIIKKP